MSIHSWDVRLERRNRAKRGNLHSGTWNREIRDVRLHAEEATSSLVVFLQNWAP